MKNNTKRILIITIAILGFFMLTLNNISAANEPTIEIKPQSPAPESTITFTPTIKDENTTEVWLHIQECDANTGICFSDSVKNESMTDLGGGKYEVSITLLHNDATYIQYWIDVKTSDAWIDYFKGSDGKGTIINLSAPVNGDDDDSTVNGGDKNGETPGFEFIGVLISVIFILLILNKRKR